MSVSYETSSTIHTSILQNERFVRDFLQKSRGKPHRSTHIKQPCQAVSRFQPLETSLRLPRKFTHPRPRAHKVLRLPRNVASATPRNLTIPCACYEIGLPHLNSDLPRKHSVVKSSSTLQDPAFPRDSSLFHTNLTGHASMQNALQKSSERLTTVAER